LQWVLGFCCKHAIPIFIFCKFIIAPADDQTSKVDDTRRDSRLFISRTICCSIDAKTDAVFNEFLRHDASFDTDVGRGRCLATQQRWRRHFHPAVCPQHTDSSPPPTVQSPTNAVTDRRLRRLGATSTGRRRSRRGGESVDSPTRPSSFRRPSPHDSIEEEDVFLPATADDVQRMTEDRCQYDLHDASNHSGSSTRLLSVNTSRRTTVIPTICVREEIETDS